MGLAYKDIDDAVLLTQNQFIKKGSFVNMQTDLMDHVAVREMWKNRKVTFEGGEDWEFWVRLADRFRIAHLPEVLAQRRVHAENVSRVHALERSAGKLQALEKMKRSYRQIAPLAAAKRGQLLREAALAAASQRRPIQASRYAVSLVAHRLRGLFVSSPRGEVGEDQSVSTEIERGKGG